MRVLVVSGEGMSSDVVHRIFQPFFQASPTEAFQPTGGLGLGLAMVKAIIDTHHGLINVQSGTGEGTRFDVLIPCSGAQEAGQQQTGKSCLGDLTGFALLAAAELTETTRRVEGAMLTGLEDFTPSPNVIGLDDSVKVRWTQPSMQTEDSAQSALKERQSSSGEAAMHSVEQAWSELPELDKGEAEEEAKPPSVAVEKKGELDTAVAGSVAVLVVDDNPINRRLSGATPGRTTHSVTHAPSNAFAIHT